RSASRVSPGRARIVGTAPGRGPPAGAGPSTGGAPAAPGSRGNRSGSFDRLSAAVFPDQGHEQADDVPRGLLARDAHTLEESGVAIHHAARAVGAREADAVEVVGDLHHGAADAVDALDVDPLAQADELVLGVEE